MTTSSSAKYRNALVTFIDVLGFREIVKTRSASEIKEIIDAVQYAGEAKEGGDPSVGLEVVAFSDSIVRVRDPDALPSALFFELLALVHMQQQLVYRGVLVRGGLTFGEIYVEGSTAFGPAFVRAYELESKTALYPRIVVDPAVLRRFADGGFKLVGHHDLAAETEYIRGVVDQADDGLWFIDYLRGADHDDPDEHPGYVAKHREMVEKVGSISELGVGVKANWLASYHNRAVDQLDDEVLAPFGLSREKLRAKDGPTRFSF